MADKFYCYGKDDLGDRYDALYVKDPEGDWVQASDYDASQARIRDLEFQISEIQTVRNVEAKTAQERIRELEAELANYKGAVDALQARIAVLKSALRDLLALADISQPSPDLVPGVVRRARAAVDGSAPSDATVNRGGEHG
jgi:polyhydroxyalkanoate synthesis regulator phasin